MAVLRGGLRVLVALLGVMVVAAGCATSFDIEQRPAAAGDPSGVAPPPTLRVGMCFTEADLGLPRTPPVSCKAPHVAEFFAVMLRSEPASDPWPGLEVVQGDASDYCNSEFGRLTGVAGEVAALDVLFFRPDETSWRRGDREVACFVRYPEETTRRLEELDPSRAFGLVSTFALAPEDCVAEPSLVDAVAVRVVPCSEPHWFEVYASVEMPDGGYPGDDAVLAFADLQCDNAFEVHVGVPRSESTLTVERLFPTERSWNDWEDRVVSCALTAGEERTVSARDSGE